MSSIERIAVTLDDTQHATRALETLNEAIARNPQSIDANYNKSLWLLSSGQFTEGWPQWEWRLKLKTAKANYEWFPIPQWKGQDLAGKNIFLWLEQGLGDQILTSSMIPDLCAVANSVTIHCYARLVPLFRRSFPKAIVINLGEPRPKRLVVWDFDYQMSVSDLGLAFRKSFDDFPKHDGFLKADPKKVEYFKKKYAQNGKVLCGLSWRSSNYLIGGGKSMKLANMARILQATDTQFVSLQYGDYADEIAEAERQFGIKIITDPEVDQLQDMDTFAAQVAAMDQVISTSNSVLHTAGALGIPSVGFIPRGASRIWYWFADRTDSPWYPSIQILRQRPVPPPYIHMMDAELISIGADSLPFAPEYSPEGTITLPIPKAPVEHRV